MSGHIFDYMLLLKCSFAVAVSMLYGWVYVLNSKQQAVVMENERLKNENLTTRYNMLVGQINPHFFFNSLNSLAMLVREARRQGADLHRPAVVYVPLHHPERPEHADDARRGTEIHRSVQLPL